MEQEQLKIKLENFKQKIEEIEELANDPYGSEELEIALQSFEGELDSFRFFLEERMY